MKNFQFYLKRFIDFCENVNNLISYAKSFAKAPESILQIIIRKATLKVPSSNCLSHKGWTLGFKGKI
jgi:hypothetical protein